MKVSHAFSISETGWSWKNQNEIKGIISHKLQCQNYFYDSKKWGLKFLIIRRVDWHRVTDVSEELHSYIFSVLTSMLFGGVTYNGFGETNFVQVLVVQILKTKFNWNSFCILEDETFGQAAAAADFGFIDHSDAVYRGTASDKEGSCE